MRLLTQSTHRGLTSDGYNIAEGDRLTAAQKIVFLDCMYGQIANYFVQQCCENSTSLDNILQAIRLHFGLPHTGAQSSAFADICQGPGENLEDLYQRLVATSSVPAISWAGHAVFLGVDDLAISESAEEEMDGPKYDMNYITGSHEPECPSCHAWVHTPQYVPLPHFRTCHSR